MAPPCRTARFALFLTLAACLLGSAAGEAAPKRFFGTMGQTPLTDADFKRMEKARVGTLRFDLNWASADPSAPVGDYNWSGIDRIVGEAARAGMTPLPYAFTTPVWVARGLDRNRCSGNRCLIFAPRSSAARAAWSDFLTAAAKRYGPGGSFWAAHPQLPRRPIRDWQVWNEQNSPSFFRPKPSPKRYAKLLASAARAIRGVDRGAEIIVGGMFGTPLGGRKPGISAPKFLSRLLSVRGARRSFDGVGVHPYAARLRGVRGQIDRIRRELRAAGDPRAELWLTELGWASSGPKRNPLVRGPRGQAKRLQQAFKLFRNKRRAWHLKTVIWYAWRDTNVPICEWCPGAGLTSKNLRPKRALRKFTRFTGGG